MKTPGQMDGADRRNVAAWLLACAALVFAMVVVGVVTRLTHSGPIPIKIPTERAPWVVQFCVGCPHSVWSGGAGVAWAGRFKLTNDN